MNQHRIPLVDALFLSCKEVVGGIEDFHFLDFVAAADGVDDVLTFGDFTEDGVFAVEVWCGEVGDEELAAVGAGAGVGHGEDAGLVVFEGGDECVAKFVARAARSGLLLPSSGAHETGRSSAGSARMVYNKGEKME